MSVAHSVVVTYNAALNRPAYQSSVYTNRWGSYVASLANDGSRETNARKDSTPRCTHTKRDTNPWWAVDLGVPTTVYKVDFTNRAAAIYCRYCGYFLSRFASFLCCYILFVFYSQGDWYHSFTLCVVTLVLMKLNFWNCYLSFTFGSGANSNCY